ncbi:MAG TPA: hypothetical protein VF771_00885 [Longimicrobiaceae bacterium]
MRKLMLDVDALAVESWATDDRAREALGTVQANAATLLGCGSGQPSCFTSCRGDLRDGCTCPPPA